jgi:hypothetical protein
MAELLIINKPYEKQAGTACYAPYVDVTISALTGRRSADVSFKARIDTGADITCIPNDRAKMLMPLLMGRPVLIRGHDGKVKRARTHLVRLSIHGYANVDGTDKTYRPERGVLLTDSDIGLIGMDVISRYWKVTFDGVSQQFCVECI